jgi:single-strand DNA-binding protein
MAQGDVQITVVGNLTGDPELRFTPSGAAVANFTVASTTRILDKQTNEWKDGDTVFLRCNVWRQYETRDGGKGTSVECEVDDVGPVLKYATAKVTKVARSGGGFGGDSGPSAPADDPWASSSPGGNSGGNAGGASGGGWGSGSSNDEPPF